METPEQNSAKAPIAAPNRRDFVGATSVAAMAGALTLSYGTFIAWAGRFLFPNRSEQAAMFVAPAAGIEPGGALTFQSPDGFPVVITRLASSAEKRDLSGADYLALSSVCPHLGCRVHWEGHNNRFFCPCHNGVFDPDGKATSGPPADAGQSLPNYPLSVENGLLFIHMPIQSIGSDAGALAAIEPAERRFDSRFDRDERGRA